MDGFQAVWGWQPALYLFLGGMGATAFVVASVVRFREKGQANWTVACSMWAAAACLILGLLCLIMELTNPLRGMMMWQSFVNVSSWMTYGAWLVFAAVVVFVISAALCTEPLVVLVGSLKPFKWLNKLEKRVRVVNVLSIVGMVLGTGVAAYTGVLLMCSTGVPLWNTWLLPCLFTVSAFDTGIALVEVIAFANERREQLTPKTRVLMERSIVVLVVLESIVLVLLLGGMLSQAPEDSLAVASTAAASAHMIVAGALSPWFWALVALGGLVLPLVVALVGMKHHGEAHAGLTLTGAIGALVGGCALRFIIVMAGIHADPVADTMAHVFADMVSRLS